MWPVWRVVLSRIATLEEIETAWSVVDLDQANQVLDYRDAVSARAAQASRRKR